MLSSGLTITAPSLPSTTTVSPFFRLDATPSTLSTAGISSALARIAEWEVVPPVSVIMPAMFSFTIPAVTEGVSSFATSTVPFGASLTLISFTPRRMPRTPLLISLTSAARCFVSSSSAAENIAINISHICSRADSAH